MVLQEAIFIEAGEDVRCARPVFRLELRSKLLQDMRGEALGRSWFSVEGAFVGIGPRGYGRCIARREKDEKPVAVPWCRTRRAWTTSVQRPTAGWAYPFVDKFEGRVAGKFAEDALTQLFVGQCEQRHGLSQVGCGQRSKGLILDLEHGSLAGGSIQEAQEACKWDASSMPPASSCRSGDVARRRAEAEPYAARRIAVGEKVRIATPLPHPKPLKALSPELRMAMRITIVLAMLAATAACAHPRPGEAGPHFDGERALTLVGDQLAFGPRIPGSPAHQAAADWIISQLAQAGWQTEEQVFEADGQTLRNLIATSGHSDAAPILLGTHYDTRPIADRDPEMPDQPVPGANDGASGVAVLLEIANVLDLSRLPAPLWLAFFDGEDGGGAAGGEWILGSRHFAQHLTVEPRAVIIVDMVGDADLQLYFEHNSDFDLASSIWATANQLGYRAFIPFPKHALVDDHIPFLDLGIPSVLIIDFDYPYWHTTHDTLDKVSADSLQQVGRTLEVWLESTN